jgi:hypothetical protein
LISGIKDTDPNDVAKTTAEKVIHVLNQQKITDGLSMADLDIAYRLPNRKGSNKDIIVRFFSRNMKEDILRKRRHFKGTGIFINEDLTLLNYRVSMSIKKKREEIGADVWMKNGKILSKDIKDKIHHVQYGDYKKWLDLPWPV